MHPLPAAARANALAVVTNPGLFADKPFLRLGAWHALMGERGKRVNQFRLTRMQRAEARGDGGRQ